MSRHHPTFAHLFSIALLVCLVAALGSVPLKAESTGALDNPPRNSVPDPSQVERNNLERARQNEFLDAQDRQRHQQQVADLRRRAERALKALQSRVTEQIEGLNTPTALPEGLGLERLNSQGANVPNDPLNPFRGNGPFRSAYAIATIPMGQSFGQGLETSPSTVAVPPAEGQPIPEDGSTAIPVNGQEPAGTPVSSPVSRQVSFEGTDFKSFKLQLEARQRVSGVFVGMDSIRETEDGRRLTFTDENGERSSDYQTIAARLVTQTQGLVGIDDVKQVLDASITPRPGDPFSPEQRLNQILDANNPAGRSIKEQFVNSIREGHRGVSKINEENQEELAKADIRDELIHRDVVFQGNIAKAIFSKALTDLQDVEELLTQAEELANNPPPSRADAGLTDPSAPGADSGAGDQASAGDGGGGGGQGSGGQGVQPAQVPFPEGPPDGGSLMQLASQNPITPGVDPSVSETGQFQSQPFGRFQGDLTPPSAEAYTLSPARNPAMEQVPANRFTPGNIARNGADLGPRSPGSPIGPAGGPSDPGQQNAGPQGPQGTGNATIAASGGGSGAAGLAGQLGNVGPEYPGRGAKLNAVKTVPYGSASLGQTADEPGTITTGAEGLGPKAGPLGNQLVPSRKIDKGFGKGFFSVFGQLALIPRLCKDNEQSQKISLCQKADGYDIEVKEGRKPTSKPTARKEPVASGPRGSAARAPVQLASAEGDQRDLAGTRTPSK